MLLTLQVYILIDIFHLLNQLFQFKFFLVNDIAYALNLSLELLLSETFLLQFVFFLAISLNLYLLSFFHILVDRDLEFVNFELTDL